MRNCIIIILFAFTFMNVFAEKSQLSLISGMQKEGAQVSVFIYNLSKKNIIGEINSELKLTPASVSKLALGACALETWGPDKTFSSKLYMRGNIKNQVLNGDIIFYGEGDPSLTTEKLFGLTSNIKHYGIKKITGKIIVNNSYFGKIIKDENRLGGEIHSQNAYDAPLSSSAINYSVVTLTIFPSKEKNAFITSEPFETQNIKIINHVTMNHNNINKIETAERTTFNNIDTYTIVGTIDANSRPIRIYRSISDADTYTGDVINEFLKQNGIKTTDKVALESTPLLATDLELSQAEGYPLSWDLNGLFKVSNNFIADMLTLNLGKEQKILNNENALKTSSHLLENYTKNSSMEFKNKNPNTVFESGSGLTPENHISSRDIVALLSHVYEHANFFPEFLASLPSPQTYGSLNRRFNLKQFNPIQTLIRAKTGTLSEPQNAVGLAGFSKLKNNDWIAFAVLVNSPANLKKLNIEDIRDKIDKDLLRTINTLN